MRVRLVAFVIWAAVAASAMFWVLRLSASSPKAPLHTVAVSAAAAPRGDLARLFGADAAAPVSGEAVAAESPLSSRFKLLGVAAPRQGGDRTGLALIAVDGKPARGYAVGAAVDGELVLQSVHARGARLGATGAAPQVTLELPALPPPATGSLPPAAGSAGAAPPPGAFAPAPVVAPPVVTAPAELQPIEQIPIMVPPPPQAAGPQSVAR